MKRGTWERAELRLQTVEEEAEKLALTREFSEHRRSWHNALNALSSAMDALKDGAKGRAESEAWADTVQKAAQASPLMTYLYAARNEEQHAVGATLAFRPASLSIPAQGGIISTSQRMYAHVSRHGGVRQVITPVEFGGSAEDKKRWNVRSEGPEAGEFTHKGRRYTAPVIHAGETLTDGSPRGLLIVALGQMRAHVRECSDIENTLADQDPAARR